VTSNCEKKGTDDLQKKKTPQWGSETPLVFSQKITEGSKRPSTYFPSRGLHWGSIA